MDVHHDDVRLGLGDDVDGVPPVLGRADDGDPVQRAEQGGETLADNLVVVDHGGAERSLTGSLVQGQPGAHDRAAGRWGR